MRENRHGGVGAAELKRHPLRIARFQVPRLERITRPSRQLHHIAFDGGALLGAQNRFGHFRRLRHRLAADAQPLRLDGDFARAREILRRIAVAENRLRQFKTVAAVQLPQPRGFATDGFQPGAQRLQPAFFKFGRLVLLRADVVDLHQIRHRVEHVAPVAGRHSQIGLQAVKARQIAERVIALQEVPFAQIRQSEEDVHGQFIVVRIRGETARHRIDHGVLRRRVLRRGFFIGNR